MVYDASVPVTNAPLTDDERVELEELRASKNEHKEVAARDRESFNRDSNVTVENGTDSSFETVDQPTSKNEEDEPLPDTHWLHLADGRVIETKGVASVYDGIPVIGSYAKPEELYNKPTPAHRF